MLQLEILDSDEKQLKLPTRIREIKIKPVPLGQTQVPVHVDR